ncbi:restriction endonuclease [Celerinatantimonas yamalensis]|uniref:Mrr-like domain-containing protein n=1 Tax=Celerinatantimonas yamalensis TaxID=559956 RepID=A0ABW9GAT4_9GAMM
MNQLQIFMPPPANWQDFQNLVVDIAKVKYVESSVQEYGRQGQNQKGIDVFAQDLMDNNIGIQCKETKKPSISKSTIDAEVEKAKKFKPSLNLLIIATTARINTQLQDYVININGTGKIPFKVQLWFWDELNQDINRFQSVMETSYEAYREAFGKSEMQNHLSAIKLAFDRPAYTDNFMHERSYGDFESAIVATRTLIKIGVLHDNWSKSVIAQTIPASMIGDERYLRFIRDIEKKVDGIYKTYQKDVKELANNPNQLNEMAGQYNILRRKLIEKINVMLSQNNLKEIQLGY